MMAFGRGSLAFHRREVRERNFCQMIVFGVSLNYCSAEIDARLSGRGCQSPIVVSLLLLLLFPGAACLKFLSKNTLRKTVGPIGSGAGRLCSKQNAGGSIPA